MKFKIFEDATHRYEDLVNLYNKACAPRERSIESMRHLDSRRGPDKFFIRLLATDSASRLVGFAEAGHDLLTTDNDNYNVDIQVSPEFQGQGIGALLYKELLKRLENRKPKTLSAECDECRERAVRFLHDRGFESVLHHIDSKLDLTSPAALVTPTARVPEGIVIKTFAQLKSEDGEELFHKKLFDLAVAITRDVPGGEAAARDATLDAYIKAIYRPGLLPDAYFIACHGTEYVGMSNFRSMNAPDEIETGLTGVLREWRGKGLAAGLKATGLDFCRRSGVRTVFTSNESNNVGILELNKKLGFTKTNVGIELVKRLEA